MGTTVRGTYPQSKQDFTVEVTPAATIALVSGNLQVFIGSLVDATHKRADIMRALNSCIDRIRENVPSYPTSSVSTMASMIPGAATSTPVLELAGFPGAITEDHVAVLYHQNFVEAAGRPAASQLFRGKHIKLWERFLEERKAA